MNLEMYPVTCKVSGQKVSGFPCFMKQVDVDQALAQDNVFPVGAVVKVYALGGGIYAHKQAGEIRLTLGDIP